MRPLLLALTLVGSVACGDSTTTPETGTTVAMSFARAAAFFDAPFPSDNLIGADGTMHIENFPNSTSRVMVADAISLIDESAHGFSLAGGVFFRLDAPIDASKLPSLAGSTDAAANVFLIGTAKDSPDYLHRYPTEISFRADEGVYSPANFLALVPLQGVPLRPKQTYAAVVMRALGDAQGKKLGQSAAMQALAAGQRPAGLPDNAWKTYQTALAALTAAGVDAKEVAAVTAFTTDDPTAGLGTFRDAAVAGTIPRPATPWTAKEVFDDYCVFSTTIVMPVYQKGTPPYTNTGGDWGVDSAGKPLLDHTETSNLNLTVPRRAQPDAGTPIMIFVRTGGGGDRPLVDRGRWDAGKNPVVAGEGPARYFARAGYAGISVDGPLSGRRYAGVDEQYVLFNVANGRALRDSIRQSALELILLAHSLDGLTVDASSCPGAPATVRFDLDHLGIMGHSTGAWIAPLVLALEPRVRIAVLSGAGGSWIDNVLYKQKPLMVAGILSVLLNESPLFPADPAITLLQWAAEPADPQVYGRMIVRERPSGAPSRSVLMEQGIIDHYITPRIANSVSLGMGLDLAGDAIDANTDIEDQLSVAPLLGFAGAQNLPAAVTGNAPGGGTAVVRQHHGDDLEDGHETVFQTEPPKNEYRCFLASFLTGAPKLIDGKTADSPCE